MADRRQSTDMTEVRSCKIAREGYSALERDDIPHFLELCTADAEWLYPADGNGGAVWETKFVHRRSEPTTFLSLRRADYSAGCRRSSPSVSSGT